MHKTTKYFIAEGLQWLLILITNLLFVCKYSPRAGLNPIICCFIYALIFSGFALLYRSQIYRRTSERIALGLSVALTALLVASIAISIIYIDPYSIGVDRWSATTFFLDGLFNGVYPYGIHTHLFESNFPSPFPLWHYLNFPFWLMGDVGWIQAFFLLVFLGAIYYYFRSWKSVLLTLLILLGSPAYWWEIATRSDGVSNILLVCACILFIERYPIKMENKWWLLAIISGCIASTRLSSVIPLALYLFYPWLAANWKVKVGFIVIATGVVFCFLVPYIFWDTNTWVFFSRNPFLSQTSLGNTWLLLFMVIIAICISHKKQDFLHYTSSTSIYMFAFMMLMLMSLIYTGSANGIFKFGCDISYLTLSVPFAVIALLLFEEQENNANHVSTSGTHRVFPCD